MGIVLTVVTKLKYEKYKRMRRPWFQGLRKVPAYGDAKVKQSYETELCANLLPPRPMSQPKPTFTSYTCNFQREKDPLSNRTTNRIDFRPHSAHRPVFHKQLYNPTTAPLGPHNSPCRLRSAEWKAGNQSKAARQD